MKAGAVRVAAVDVGTNSVRLLVADATGGVVAEIERTLAITRLGEGVDATRRLQPAPLARTVARIAADVERARELGATRIRVVATSAVRDAANAGEFAAAVHAASGLVPEVVSGQEEARLAFAGATTSLHGPVLVVDVGGGSTEFVYGHGRVEAACSLDVGSVRLTERHVRADPPEAFELDAVRAEARRAVQTARSALAATLAEAPRPDLVGVAGTITTIAAIALGLAGYDRDAIHHARLARATVGEIAARLAAMTVAERRTLPAMPLGREDVIVAGALLLESAMDGLGFDEILVSETDILDGIALSIAVA